MAATLALKKAKLLDEDTVAKVGGSPGEAFGLVYASVSARVGQKVYEADPALAEWIRLHCYGDIYSSPGISMKCKQLLMCARLAQANMGDQLFGHAIAALRFGNTKEHILEAVNIAFEIDPSPEVQSKSLEIIEMAASKFARDLEIGAQGIMEDAEVKIEDPACIRIPELLLGQSEHDRCANGIHPTYTKETYVVQSTVEDGFLEGNNARPEGFLDDDLERKRFSVASQMQNQEEGKNPAIDSSHKFSWEILNDSIRRQK